MSNVRLFILTIALLTAAALSAADRQNADQEKLGRAIEYFQSGKYQEALILFEELDKHYKLNDRYRAYIGLCCYYDWQFEKACKYLDEVTDRLQALSPHERSIYYYANAESHFHIEQYPQAIPYYEQMLLVCHDNEKPDAYYRLGMCYMFAEEWAAASEYFRSAIAYYEKYRQTEADQPRIAQLNAMLKGCLTKLHDEDSE